MRGVAKFQKSGLVEKKKKKRHKEDGIITGKYLYILKNTSAAWPQTRVYMKACKNGARRGACTRSYSVPSTEKKQPAGLARLFLHVGLAPFSSKWEVVAKGRARVWFFCTEESGTEGEETAR